VARLTRPEKGKKGGRKGDSNMKNRKQERGRGFCLDWQGKREEGRERNASLLTSGGKKKKNS